MLLTVRTMQIWTSNKQGLVVFHLYWVIAYSFIYICNEIKFYLQRQCFFWEFPQLKTMSDYLLILFFGQKTNFTPIPRRQVKAVISLSVEQKGVNFVVCEVSKN